ncbi:carbohydrate ABC transporter permease [Ideonella sp. BN130291]|uniref:carbohydrate ABC transporter permease n=1 Tax=Ideonella sp. BN130291 TaxID=3112940 RepID=UPI002E258E18|nr:carbohydrate ABC transporter permease [Ideonella sp. BN130291]
MSIATVLGRNRGDRIAMVAVMLFALVWVLPLLWVLALSFKPNQVLQLGTAVWYEAPFTWRNYHDIVATSQLFRWIANSCIVALGQTVLVLAVSSLAGYAFARLEFPGRKLLFAAVLAGLAIPQAGYVAPLHRLFADWGLHNTHAALILPGVAAPFGVFLMSQYFKAIPIELEEAALLDNASRWTVFWKVVLPLSLPAQATLGIFTFLNAWNDYLWPVMSATQPAMYTLSLGLASMQTNFAQSEGLGFLMAQAVFAAIPVLVLYAFFQRHIVAAVAGGVR